jgi:SAM-dependent methyltransferase
MARVLLDALSDTSAERVLDLGCGTGELLPFLQETFQGSWLLGADLSAGMAAIAGRDTTASVCVMNAQQLALADGSFDLAVLPFMLFHLPDPLAGLRETRRVLRAAGRVGVVTWGDGSDEPWEAICDEELDAHGAAPIEAAPSVRRFELMDTPDKLSELLSAAGLAPERVWYGDFVHTWTVQSLLDLLLGLGLPARRLASLTEQRQTACRERIEERLLELTAEQLVERKRLVYAIACR